MDGIGLGMLAGKTRDFVKIASDIGQNYYHEMLGAMFLINTPFFFGGVLTLVKGFIDKKEEIK